MSAAGRISLTLLAALSLGYLLARSAGQLWSYGSCTKWRPGVHVLERAQLLFVPEFWPRLLRVASRAVSYRAA